ncbi:MAG: FAD-dependent oxidoreductase, partial [Candidatus Hydrogenedentales bacterium]
MRSVTLQALSCDVFLAGGGPAGIACALAAARNGARTVLCQDRPVLGGNASSEVRMHIVGADCSGKRCAELATEAREGGIVEEIRIDNAVRNPQRSASMMDLILYEKCRAEPNLTLLLNTTVVAARTENRRIVEVQAERPSTEDRFMIAAQVFVDCTGDGRLGVEAGASFREGREARDAFDESLAPLRPDTYRLGSTLLFQARKHDHPMPFVAPAFARTFTEDDLRLRPHATAIDDYGHEYGYWWVEWGGTLDTIKDNEAIRDELLAIQVGVWDHIKNGGDHGAECWALEWVGFLPGKRESRRFIGLHTLTQDDVMQSRAFDDAIAYGGWPIDMHPPRGVDAPDEQPCEQHPVPNLYDIPLRCCISRDVENLMFAGRNMSATHVAFSSTRVMATCFVVGQGVGVAAAHAVAMKTSPSALPGNREAMKAIQQALLRDDCYLIGLRNEDGAAIARSAHVTASSEQPDGPASAVLSGQTRSVHGAGGAPADRARPGTHRWMSDPSSGLPAWLMLSWDRPILPREIRVVFDTGLHRVL